MRISDKTFRWCMGLGLWVVVFSLVGLKIGFALVLAFTAHGIERHWKD